MRRGEGGRCTGRKTHRIRSVPKRGPSRVIVRTVSTCPNRDRSWLGKMARLRRACGRECAQERFLLLQLLFYEARVVPAAKCARMCANTCTAGGGGGPLPAVGCHKRLHEIGRKVLWPPAAERVIGRVQRPDAVRERLKRDVGDRALRGRERRTGAAGAGVCMCKCMRACARA
jgi:hypothetical protein